MDFNATIDLIIKELDDARKIIDDLKKYPGVPLLQIELAKSKCKSAGEVISLLKQEVRIQESDIGIERMDAKSTVSEVQNSENEILMPDALSLKPERHEQKKDSSGKSVPESGIIGDSFSHLSGKLNDQLGNRKTEDDFSEIMKSKPLSSLTEAIGINDRFFFIREIFNGNKEAYSHAIARLENIESINDARAVIISYTGENKENEAFKQLLDLVKRKLSSNE